MENLVDQVAVVLVEVRVLVVMGNQPAPPNNWPQPVGNPGGSRGGASHAGGGGGFISAGQNGVDPNPGDGGAGITT